MRRANWSSSSGPSLAPALALMVLGGAGCGSASPPLLGKAELMASLPVGLSALAPGRVAVVRGVVVPGAPLVALYEGAPTATWAATREVSLASLPELPSGSGELNAAAQLATDGGRLLLVRTAPAPKAGSPAVAPAVVPAPVAPASGSATPAPTGMPPVPPGGDIRLLPDPAPGMDVVVDLYDTGTGTRLGGFRTRGHLLHWRAASDLSSVVLVLHDRVQRWTLPDSALGWEQMLELSRDVVLADGSRRAEIGHAAVSGDASCVIALPPTTTGLTDARVIEVGVGEAPEARRYLGEAPLAISTDAVFLATRVGDDVQVYDVAAGKLLYTLKHAGMHDPVAMAFLPGGRELLIERTGVASSIYDWRSGEELTVLPPGLRDVSISPEGDRLVAAAADGLHYYRIR